MSPVSKTTENETFNHKINSRQLTECYICGASAAGEPREHTTPRCMGGVDTILDGCCPKCHSLTASAEDSVFRKNSAIRIIRHLLELPDGKQQKKSSRDIVREIASLRRSSLYFSLPEMQLPLSLDLKNIGTHKQILFRFSIFGKSCDILSPSYRSATNMITPEMLAPVIAKVAYANAMLCFGENYFTPFLQKQIINPHRVDHVYIGGDKDGLCTKENFICERSTVKGMSVSFHKWDVDLSSSLLLSQIKIFPQFPTPKYLAVVGAIVN